jgi:PAS domain S-box-containing protein
MNFLSASGMMGFQISATDWSEHPLGPVSGWTPAFRTALSMVLNSGFPSYVLWGPEFFVFYNDAYAPILGKKVELGQGVPLRELWAEIADEACQIANIAFAGQPTYFKDRRFVLERFGQPQQAYFTFSFSPIRDEVGVVVGVLCTIVETTDTVLTHARLKESEERLRISLDASNSIGTWSYYPDTQATFVDERFARLFQVDAALAQGGTELERFTNMIHPDDRERVVAAIGHAITTGELYDINYRIPQLSGKIIWITAKGRMFEDADTGQKRFAGVAFDITEIRKTNEQLLQLADDLKTSNTRQTDFLATLAHELRNPLAPIRTGLELMRVSAPNLQTTERLRSMMARQVNQLTHLIDDLMDVSRINSGKVELQNEIMDISVAIQVATETSLPFIEAAQHELVMQVSNDRLLVNADPIRVAQVLSNILTNAAKYTPKGGRIDVCSYRENGSAFVSISDTGMGIPETEVSNIFDMFTQVSSSKENSQGGLGIGLSLVKRLIELQNGTVTVFSAGAGKGATFIVRLPLVTDEALVQPESDTLSAQIPQAGKILRILVADDNKDAADMLASVLSFQGHTVQIAADGEEALLIAKSFIPHVAFLDIGMPKMDGRDVAREIRKSPHLEKTLLVAVTGWGSLDDRASTKVAGFDYHFTKPVDLTDMERLLTRIEHV